MSRKTTYVIIGVVAIFAIFAVLSYVSPETGRLFGQIVRLVSLIGRAF